MNNIYIGINIYISFFFRCNSESPALPTKEELGERIYETISKWYSDDEQAAKLTGMILEMNNNEIVELTQEEELLKNIVNKAEQALR